MVRTTVTVRVVTNHRSRLNYRSYQHCRGKGREKKTGKCNEVRGWDYPTRPISPTPGMDSEVISTLHELLITAPCPANCLPFLAEWRFTIALFQPALLEARLEVSVTNM